VTRVSVYVSLCVCVHTLVITGVMDDEIYLQTGDVQ